MSVLEVTGLSWGPPEEELILRGVDFAVEAGESVAILGPSGSGKSTILRCVVALQRFDEGEVRFRGEPVTASNILDVRRHVGFVAQKPAPVAETVAENLAFAREMSGIGEENQREMMRRFGLDDLPSDRDFSRLSVGEQQRLCFVRALTLEPVILLLDEPTSALDAMNVESLESLVEEWLDEDPERAAIWVTHDDAQADRVARRHLRLRGGRIE